MRTSVVNVFLVLALICVTQFSCSSEKKVTVPMWQEYYGEFATRDLQLAQEQIPFRIIVPSPLPENIAELPSLIKGHMKDAFPEEDVRLLIQFVSREGAKPATIYIREELIGDNVTHFLPSTTSNNQCQPTKILGFQVVECNNYFPSPSSHEETLEGIEFYWMQNSVSFDVGVYGFGRDECISIIESMIIQSSSKSE